MKNDDNIWYIIDQKFQYNVVTKFKNTKYNIIGKLYNVGDLTSTKDETFP